MQFAVGSSRKDLTINTQVCLIEEKHVTTRLLHMNYGVTAGLHGLAYQKGRENLIPV